MNYSIFCEIRKKFLLLISLEHKARNVKIIPYHYGRADEVIKHCAQNMTWLDGNYEGDHQKYSFTI